MLLTLITWDVLEEISVHLQIFVLDATVDPDNLGERKIQTSAPNPNISVLLLNFCARKRAAFTAHSQEYQARATITSNSNLMFYLMLTRPSTPTNEVTNFKEKKLSFWTGWGGKRERDERSTSTL